MFNLIFPFQRMGSDQSFVTGAFCVYSLVHAVACDNSLTYTISQPRLLNRFVYH